MAYLGRHGRPIGYGYLAGRYPLADHQTRVATAAGDDVRSTQLGTTAVTLQVMLVLASAAMRGVRVEIATADPAVLRPQDLRECYANPAKELQRLSRAGVVLHLAYGYYAVVPERCRGTAWRPPVEAVGLAIAQADYGRDRAAAMGITAARLLGAVPRALGTAVIVVPRQRRPLQTAAGRIWFVTRQVERLDVQRVETELATGWTTTAEQTVVDLADRPALGALAALDVTEAILRLGGRVDWQLVTELAERQRRRPAAARAAALSEAGPPERTGPRTSCCSGRPWRPTDLAGLAPTPAPRATVGPPPWS